MLDDEWRARLRLARGARIGPVTFHEALQHFGSAKAVSRASPDDIVAVSGISRAMAQTIYDFFHERRD